MHHADVARRTRQQRLQDHNRMADDRPPSEGEPTAVPSGWLGRARSLLARADCSSDESWIHVAQRGSTISTYKCTPMNLCLWTTNHFLMARSKSCAVVPAAAA
jgi:hypothetical protein